VLQKKPSVKEGKRDKVATYFPFICSSGERIIDVYVFPMNGDKCDFTITQTSRPKRNSIPTYFCFSDNGWLKKETF
jgi:hypothetical protein